MASVHSNLPVIVSHLWTETFGLNALFGPRESLARRVLLLLVKIFTLEPSSNSFSVKRLPTKPVPPEIAIVIGASRSFFCAVAFIALVLSLLLLVGGDVLSTFSMDDVLIIRVRRRL